MRSTFLFEANQKWLQNAVGFYRSNWITCKEPLGILMETKAGFFKAGPRNRTPNLICIRSQTNYEWICIFCFASGCICGYFFPCGKFIRLISTNTMEECTQAVCKWGWVARKGINCRQYCDNIFLAQSGEILS